MFLFSAYTYGAVEKVLQINLHFFIFPRKDIPSNVSIRQSTIEETLSNRLLCAKQTGAVAKSATAPVDVCSYSSVRYLHGTLSVSQTPLTDK